MSVNLVAQKKYAVLLGGPIDIAILNTFGQVIKRQSYHNLQIGSNKVEMNLSDLPGGLYFYSLISHGRQLDMKKLIKK